MDPFASPFKPAGQQIGKENTPTNASSSALHVPVHFTAEPAAKSPSKQTQAYDGPKGLLLSKYSRPNEGQGMSMPSPHHGKPKSPAPLMPISKTPAEGPKGRKVDLPITGAGVRAPKSDKVDMPIVEAAVKTPKSDKVDIPIVAAAVETPKGQGIVPRKITQIHYLLQQLQASIKEHTPDAEQLTQKIWVELKQLYVHKQDSFPTLSLNVRDWLMSYLNQLTMRDLRNELIMEYQKQFQNKLTTKDAVIADVTGHAEEKLKDLEGRCARLTVENFSFQTKLALAEANLKDAEQNLDDLQKSVDAKMREQDNLHDRIKTLEGEIESWAAKLESTKQAQAATAKDGSLEEASRKLLAEKEISGRLRLEVNELKGSQQTQQNKYNQLANEHAGATKTARSLEVQCDHLQSEVSKLANEKSALQDKVQAHLNEKRGLQDQLSSAKNNIKQLEKDVSNLKWNLADIQEKDNKAKNLQDEFAKLQDKYNREVAKSTKMQNENVQLHVRIKQLFDEKDELKTDRDEAVKARSKAEQEKLEVNTLCIKLQKENQDFKNVPAAQMPPDVAELFKAITAEKEALKTSRDEWEGLARAAYARVQVTEQQVATLNEDLDGMKKTIDRLTIELDKARAAPRNSEQNGDGHWKNMYDTLLANVQAQGRK